MVSNPIIDEDETLEPLVGGESPEDHQISVPLEPAQSNTFATFTLGTLFDTSLMNYSFDFNERIHFGMNGLNSLPYDATNSLDSVNQPTSANMLNLDLSQFTDLDMSANQDLFLRPL